MKATLRKMGNSQGVIIPKTLIAQFGFETEVEMRVTETGIVLEKPKAHPREGWDEAYKALADEPIDHEWLDFPGPDIEEGDEAGDEDGEWTW
jgi:antitoxin MazE